MPLSLAWRAPGLSWTSSPTLNAGYVFNYQNHPITRARIIIEPTIATNWNQTTVPTNDLVCTGIGG